MSDIKKIAIHYLKGSCIFDFLALIPFELFLLDAYVYNSVEYNKMTRMLRLLKLMRVPRLFELLNVDRFKQVINDYYNKILEKSVRENSEGDAYPILRALMYLQLYKIFRLVILIFGSSYFLGILWHIYCVDIITTEWVDPKDKSLGSIKPNFRTTMLFHDTPGEDVTEYDMLVRVWYFAITTLSTIGYGDYHPVSTEERMMASLILMFGVAIFSFIMG